MIPGPISNTGGFACASCGAWIYPGNVHLCPPATTSAVLPSPPGATPFPRNFKCPQCHGEFSFWELNHGGECCCPFCGLVRFAWTPTAERRLGDEPVDELRKT